MPTIDDIKCKLTDYKGNIVEIKLNEIAKISGVSQSNVIIIMKNGKNYTGTVINF